MRSVSSSGVTVSASSTMSLRVVSVGLLAYLRQLGDVDFDFYGLLRGGGRFCGNLVIIIAAAFFRLLFRWENSVFIAPRVHRVRDKLRKFGSFRGAHQLVTVQEIVQHRGDIWRNSVSEAGALPEHRFYAFQYPPDETAVWRRLEGSRGMARRAWWCTAR